MLLNEIRAARVWGNLFSRHLRKSASGVGTRHESGLVQTRLDVMCWKVPNQTQGLNYKKVCLSLITMKQFLEKAKCFQ